MQWLNCDIKEGFIETLDTCKAMKIVKNMYGTLLDIWPDARN